MEGDVVERASWTVVVGDTVAIDPPKGARIHLGRKIGALIAYLALEGSTPRARLADMLWPDASSARGSLRQVLHTLRLEAPIVDDGDPLALLDEVVVTRGHAILLAGYDVSDCPSFEEWLVFRRESERASRLERLTTQADELEAEGEIEQALHIARRALVIDPLSELGHRRVMRLAYLAGDRAGALDAYHTCVRVLREFLGVRPLPETVALARSIENATVERIEARRRTIPVTVDRPPILAGRQRACERMDEAWSKGQVIFLSGAPGVGKTRLMHDFAGSKVPRHRWNMFTARPGDKSTPYASQTRAFRAVLDACKGIELTPVMRRELARLLPEYADTPPQPMTSLEEKNFFYATLAEVLIASGNWLDCWIADDWQFVDSASLEMSNYMFANVTPVATGRKGQRAICTFRTHEIGDDFTAFLAGLVRGGIAIHIELEPLEANAVTRLLESTDVPGAADLAPTMHRFTGGNPLFVIETLKSMLEADELSEARMASVFPNRVAEIFEERFRRLSWSQLRFLQFLAVVQTDASPALARNALGLDDRVLATGRAELERARLIDGFAFSHDLVYEAVRHATPAPIRNYLHRRAADALAALGGSPARVAYHYRAAGETERALPHLLAAAEEAKVRGAFKQAAEWYRWIIAENSNPERVRIASLRLREVSELAGSSPGS